MRLEVPIIIPQYRCHKIVRAAKIVGIELERGATDQREVELQLDSRRVSIYLPQPWFERHDPKVGGYLVIYDDGYTSFSPAKAFEDGYTRLEA